MEGEVQTKECKKPPESGNCEEVPEDSSTNGALPTPGF